MWKDGQTSLKRSPSLAIYNKLICVILIRWRYVSSSIMLHANRLKTKSDKNIQNQTPFGLLLISGQSTETIPWKNMTFLNLK